MLNAVITLWIACCILGQTVTAFCDQQAKLEPSILSTLSSKERDDLKLFFHDLFVENELGYTLFADKPMSFCVPNVFCPRFSQKDFTYRFYLDEAKPLFKGHTVWKKIRQHINPKSYLLIIVEEKNFPTFALLINKQAFREQFQKHKDLFVKYYGKSVTADFLLSDLEKKSDCKKIFENSFLRIDSLLGIMLGFGRHNAELFQRREELTFPKSPYIFPTLNGGHPTPSPGFCSITAETEYLWGHLKPTRGLQDCLLRVIGVGFVGDPDDLETEHLVQKYEVQHEKLITIFDSDDWLQSIVVALSKNTGQ